jgi:hypothetical protein
MKVMIEINNSVVRYSRSLLFVLVGVLGGAGLVYAASSMRSYRYDENYASDRSQIEDLQARYLFAMNWLDAEAYAETFTGDGELDWAGGVARGREAIREEVGAMAAAFAAEEAADAPLRPARKRHFITNVVIKVDGDTATSRAYWFIMNNRTADRKGYSEAYGHYESELRKVDGQWYFTKRKIFNEEMADRTAPLANPAS